jgi:hypothetical protein
MATTAKTTRATHDHNHSCLDGHRNHQGVTLLLPLEGHFRATRYLRVRPEPCRPNPSPNPDTGPSGPNCVLAQGDLPQLRAPPRRQFGGGRGSPKNRPLSPPATARRAADSLSPLRANLAPLASRAYPGRALDCRFAWKQQCAQASWRLLPLVRCSHLPPQRPA